MNWKAITDEALGHLTALLRFDTTNPPGNEILCAQYLRDVLDAEGIESRLLEAAPGRANLIARLPGSGRAGGPLLLTSHTDVVPAEPSQWRFPPFSATEADGFLWGRGAVDMKQMTAYNLAALLWLKRSGAKLTRDVIFAAVADEEAGCRYGSTWLVENHRTLIEAEFGLNEVGGFQLHLGRKYLYPVQVAEKGFVWLRMTVRGEPGHGSMPHDRNAIVKLARILDRVHRQQLPVHIHPVAESFVREAGETLGYPAKALLLALLQPFLSDRILSIFPDRDKAKAFNAMLRNTVTPTGLAAGRKENVIPGSASCVLDCRILPGQTKDDLLRELRQVCAEPVELEVIQAAEPHVVPTDTTLYRLIEEVVAERDPDGRVVPYLTVGFTDSCNYARNGTTCYGFTPLQLPPDVSFAALFHGHNERIPLAGFRWGVRTFLEVVRRFVVAPR